MAPMAERVLRQSARPVPHALHLGFPVKPQKIGQVLFDYGNQLVGRELGQVAISGPAHIGR